MRCRKVRSFLSAYCKGELPEKRTGAIASHLEGCPRCRSEETAYREINDNIGILPQYSVSEDFNSRLLKRIAEERFKETRSKAYLPKKIPVVTFGRLAPVIAAASFIIAFVFTGGIERFIGNENNAGIVTAELDDSYMTAEPGANHPVYQSASANWAFNNQLARVTRIKGLMTQLSGPNSFGSLASSSAGRYNSRYFYRLQPNRSIIGNYGYTTNNTVREVNYGR